MNEVNEFSFKNKLKWSVVLALTSICFYLLVNDFRYYSLYDFVFLKETNIRFFMLVLASFVFGVILKLLSIKYNNSIFYNISNILLLMPVLYFFTFFILKPFIGFSGNDVCIVTEDFIKGFESLFSIDLIYNRLRIALIMFIGLIGAVISLREFKVDSVFRFIPVFVVVKMILLFIVVFASG